MNYPKEELRLPTGASDDHKSHFSWQLGVYAILVTLAIYYLCVA
jgi:hypothetical protein